LLELPGVHIIDKLAIFERTLQATAGKAELLLVVADVESLKSSRLEEDYAVVTGKNNVATIVRAQGGKLSVSDDGRIVLALPAEATDARLAMWSGPVADVDKALAAMTKLPAARDLAKLTHGGKPRWTETVETTGRLAKEDSPDAYVLDELTLPENNPYKSWIRVGGFDFLPSGRASLSTWSGDVWICSGIDESLQKLTWKRYATGLFHALGLKVVDGQVYTLGRDQITRLHDLNNDGEADFYECFNNDVFITQNFHEFAYELQTDAEGNFYFIKGGPVRPGGSGWDKIVPHHG
jgi:hypothetical protein